MNSKFQSAATLNGEQQTLKLKNVLCLDINTDRRLAIGSTIAKAFPEYDFENRCHGIVSKVAATGAELVMLCEVDAERIDFFETQFSLHGYKCRHVAYNQSQGAFSFLILSQNEEFLKNIEAFPLTESGLYVENSARPCAPKAGETPTPEYLAYKEEILLDSYDKTVIKVSIGNVDYYCTHLAQQNNARMFQTLKLRKIVETQSIDKFRSAIICGNFNSFDVTKSTPTLLAEQIEILASMGAIKWNSKNIPLTFRAFIFDIVFKMTTKETEKYFRLLNAGLVVGFRVFCKEMMKKYGLDGIALDHVFSTADLQVNVEAIDMGSLSDHFMMFMTIE